MSSSRVDSTEFSDSLPSFPILLLLLGLLDCIKCPNRAGPYWSANTSASMYRRPWDNITNEFVLTFSSNTQHVLFVLLGWFVRWEVNADIATFLLVAASRIGSKHHVAFLCSSHLAFSPCFFVRVHMLHPYSSTDTTTSWKKKPVLFHQIFICSKTYLWQFTPSLYGCWHHCKLWRT